MSTIQCSFLGVEVKDAAGKVVKVSCYDCASTVIHLPLAECHHPKRRPLKVSARDCLKCPYLPPQDKPKPPENRKPCVHLGNMTGRLIDCTTCKGHSQLKAHACAVHGECLPPPTLMPADVICCLNCPDYKPIQ